MASGEHSNEYGQERSNKRSRLDVPSVIIPSPSQAINNHPELATMRQKLITEIEVKINSVNYLDQTANFLESCQDLTLKHKLISALCDSFQASGSTKEQGTDLEDEVPDSYDEETTAYIDTLKRKLADLQEKHAALELDMEKKNDKLNTHLSLARDFKSNWERSEAEVFVLGRRVREKKEQVDALKKELEVANKKLEDAVE